MPMNQSGTEHGPKGETGEREPKGAISSDKSGERSVKMTNGVGMGMKDAAKGRPAGAYDDGEYNTGKKEGNCYSHKRIPHAQG